MPPRRNPKWLTPFRPEDLIDFYWDLGWGMPRIARLLGVTPNTIRRFMLKAGIETRHTLNRWYNVTLWCTRKEFTEESRDPSDPAGYWGCRTSSRAGIGCLFCQARPPMICEGNCACCPPEVIANCSCAKYGTRPGATPEPASQGNPENYSKEITIPPERALGNPH